MSPPVEIAVPLKVTPLLALIFAELAIVRLFPVAFRSTVPPALMD